MIKINIISDEKGTLLQFFCVFCTGGPSLGPCSSGGNEIPDDCVAFKSDGGSSRIDWLQHYRSEHSSPSIVFIQANRKRRAFSTATTAHKHIPPGLRCLLLFKFWKHSSLHDTVERQWEKGERKLAVRYFC